MNISFLFAGNSSSILIYNEWLIDYFFIVKKKYERKNSKNNSSIHFEYIVMQGLDSDEDATHCQE